MKTLFMIFLSMRPRQWAKNLFIFPALLFSKNLFVSPMVAKSIEAFFIFCLLSGAIYIFNDLFDVHQDRTHPLKCARPIASGKLSPSKAKGVLVVFAVISLAAAFSLGPYFGAVAVGYALIQVAYSIKLKRIVIIELFSVASGFFLRVLAGALAIQVPTSSWLLICTLFISLFLAIGKRRHELLFLGDYAAQHRQVLGEYNIGFLNQMASVATTGTVLSYSLYTLSSETVEKFHTKNLWLTVPIVLFGVFRYLYCVYRKKEGGSPESVLFEDKPLMVSIIAYVIAVTFILYI